MLATRLHNLDELALSVRDPQTRGYVHEVIDAHRAGANRAAIVTLWAAVAYDVIQKIRELAASEDGIAVDFVSTYDKAAGKNDFRTLSIIEEQIVDTAESKFEMLQRYEAQALTRLREDRHRCAHPAMTVTDTLFQPSPEAVQAHIVHAVTYLLAHQPMQGKAALERVYSDITSPSFPSDSESATRMLQDRYLKRAKPSLTRQLTKILIRKHIGQSAAKDVEVFSVALRAVLATQRSVCEAVLREDLPKVAPSTPDERRFGLLALVDIDARCWDWVGDADRIAVQELLRKGQHYEQYTPQILSGASKVEELASLLRDNYASLSDGQKLRVAELDPRPEYVEPAIAKYAAVTSFREAGSVGEKMIVPLAKFMSADNVRDVLRVAAGNGQIYLASETLGVLNSLFDSTLQLLPSTFEAWREYVASRQKDEDLTYRYPDLAMKLETHRPTLAASPGGLMYVTKPLPK